MAKNNKWKKEDYKEFVLNMIRDSGSVDAYRRIRIADAYDFYYGKNTNSGYENLLTLHETSDQTGGKTPFVPVNYDAISPKINSLLGDLSNMGFEVNVKAVNREAIERKAIFMRQLQYMSTMQPFFEKAQQYTGVPVGVNKNLPRTPKQLHQYMKSYTDTYERLVTAAINLDIERQLYRHRRENLFLDLLASGEVHAKVELVDGYLKIRRINPLNCIPDCDIEDDYGSDQSKFMEARYVSIPYAIEYYDIEEDHMKELIENYKSGKTYSGINSKYNGKSYSIFEPFRTGSRGWNGTEYEKVLVIEAEWLDVELRSQKVTNKPDGRLFVNEYVDDPRKARLRGAEKDDENNTSTHKKIEVVRKATLLGGDIITDYGKTGSYIRTKTNPCKTRLNYVSLFHSYNNQDSVSLIDRLGRIQDFKNYALTLLQKHVTSYIGDFVAIDSSRIDNEIYGKAGKEAYQNLLLELKAYKVLVYNSAKGGFGADPNAIPFKNVAAQSQAIVSDLINLVLLLDAEMKSISGINEARMGQFGERTLKTTAQLGQQASFSMTATYFNSFTGFEKTLFSVYAQALSMAWANEPEKYEEIAINNNIDLPEDFEIDGQTYEAVIQTAPLSRQELRDAAAMALQGGQISVPDYLDVMDVAVHNRREAYEELKRRIREREEAMLQRQEQMQLAQMEADQNKANSLIQGELAKEKMRGEYLLRSTDKKADAQVESSVIKSAGDEVNERNKYEVEKEKNQTERFKALMAAQEKKREKETA